MTRRPSFLTARGFRWLVAFPFALGLLIYGLAHGYAPPAKAYFAPWSLIAR